MMWGGTNRLVLDFYPQPFWGSATFLLNFLGGATVGGAQVWVVPEAARRPAVVLVLTRADPRTADLLRRQGVRRADVVVVTGSDPALSAIADPLARRLRARVVLAPAGARLAMGAAPPAGSAVAAGVVTVHVTAATDRRLSVEVEVEGEE